MAGLCEKAESAVRGGSAVLVLSDRGVNEMQAPIPSLLATAAVHHHLVRAGIRTGTTLVVETAEAREVHHFALLVGYGATAINPYLAFETLEDMAEIGPARGREPEEATKNFIKAIGKGLLKVISKMGISTLFSYCGAQIFEAVGLDQEVIDAALHRHRLARRGRRAGRDRARGPRAAPEGVRVVEDNAGSSRSGASTSSGCRASTTSGTRRASRRCSAPSRPRTSRPSRSSPAISTNRARASPRSGDSSSSSGDPIPVEEVEPASEIVKRFTTGAMSLGSISKEAHETLAIAMNRIGGKSNTGEGGEDPARFTPGRRTATTAAAP